MRIKKMTATFGCLNGAEMSFNDGLNVITAANESGKSTWCAFMRAMLYGVDSSQRAKAGVMPDKQRYAPWSGAPMEGTMELTSGGRDITICRRTRLSGAPMSDFSAVYTGTGQPVPGLTGPGAGEALTGISAEVLRRSAFISQGEIPVSGSPELEKRIASVVTSGEEGTSYTEADSRLRSWQRKRQFNRRGAIPELDGEISRQRQLLGEMSDARQRTETLSAQLAEAQKRREELGRESEAYRAETVKRNKELLDAARKNEKTLEDGYHEAVRRSGDVKAGMDDVFAGMEPFEAYKAVDADVERAEALISGRKPAFWLAIVFAVLALAACAAGYLYFWHGYFVSAAFGLAAVAAFIVSLSVRSGNIKKAAEREEILSKYGAHDEEGIIARAEEYSKAYKDLKDADAEEETARAAMEAAREERNRLEQKLLDGPGPEVDAEYGPKLTELTARVTTLTAQLAELSGRSGVLGDPADIECSLAEKQQRKSELAEQYDAIAIAMDTLRDADSEMQSRFSPKLAQTAAKYMERLTGGRYSEVTLSRDLTAMTRLTGDSVPHETAYMSTGATDMLYLAVRLAVCELALPENDPCPLILDDALVNFDPEREERVMELLREIAEKRQIIMFTCK